MNEHTSLALSCSPHLHSGASTRCIMLDVLIALLPAAIMSVWLFGWRAAAVELVCIASCMASEILSAVVLKKPQTVGDLSCAVTGLLLAFNLPVSIPLWQAALGGVAAIVVVKQMFGGIGCNFVNPALVGRIVLLCSFPAVMNTWTLPLPLGVDAVATATPLAQMANGETLTFGVRELLLGLRPGSLGETCVVALLLGFVYLLVRRVITPLVPAVYIGTVFVLSWIIAGDAQAALYQILSGGLMLGAIFMATDYTTSPITPAGKAVFAVGCGLLTVLIRQYGSLPEGVSFAIVIMNILTPLIERVTRPMPFGKRRFGARKGGAAS